MASEPWQMQSGRHRSAAHHGPSACSQPPSPWCANHSCLSTFLCFLVCKRDCRELPGCESAPHPPIYRVWL